MEWFSNLKVSKKIISSFIVVALITGIMGVYSVSNINSMKKADMELYNNMTVPMYQMGEISTEFQRIRSDIRDMIFAQSQDDIESNLQKIDDSKKNIADLSATFSQSIVSSDMKLQYDSFVTSTNAFYVQLDKIIELAKQNKDAEAIVMLDQTSDAGKASKLEQDNIDKIISMKNDDASANSVSNNKTASNTITIMIIVIIFVLAVAILIGIYISGLITKPIKRALYMIQEMSKGHLGERLNVKAKDEVGQMAEAMDSFADLLQKDMIGVMDKISKGDVSMDVEVKDEKDEIAPALKRTVETIRNINKDTAKLIQAVSEGKLDIRGNSDAYSGKWKEQLEEINKLLDTIIKPINEVTMVMNEISQGNLGVTVKGDYKGEFDILAKSVNTTAEDLRLVVGTIADITGEMAKGNLDIAKVPEFRGEFNNISESLVKIIDSLNSELSEINTASDQVSTGANQVSFGSQSLSQGATEQASAIEELTASITEVAAQTKENATNANQANELALEVKENAEKGNIHMSEMLSAMGDINESSANISKIIKVIDEIAFQTNILALNAAVEAARAGQHGKGFAVVAEEVRNLAARSANAAKETTVLIEGSIQKAENGTEIANETAKALNDIVDGVSKAAEIIAEIAASSNEQASGISQINIGIEQVSQVVQTNSATAEESAAASEELSSQAQVMKDLVGNFKLKNMKKSIAYNRADEIPYKEVATNIRKPKIALNDKEFGKY